MIYLLSTNRPNWAEFAYKQYKKAGGDLVVLDNSEKGIFFWEDKGEHHHIPQCKNVSQMFNWYLDRAPNDDIFYMDDDIEIYPDTMYEMRKWLRLGYDCVKLLNVYVTDMRTGERTTWHRREKNVGAAWMASRDLWKCARFNEKTIEGVCHYFMALWDYNCR